LINVLTLCSLLTCLTSFLIAQLGESSILYYISYGFETSSHFFNFSSLLAIIIIVFDKRTFLDCYDFIVNPITRTMENYKKKQEERESFLKTQILSGLPTDSSASIQTSYAEASVVMVSPLHSSQESNSIKSK